MSGRELFGALLRVVGLVVALLGVQSLVNYVQVTVGRGEYPYSSSPSSYVVYGVVFVLIGIALLRGAPLIEGFAYWQPLAGDSDHPEHDGPEQSRPGG